MNLHAVIEYVSAHPQLAYGVVFVVALLEAIPVLGSVIPGSTTILGISALIATGDLALSGVLCSAICGAVLGDWTAFWLGQRYPESIRHAWPLSKYPAIVERSEEFFRRRGTYAVFFARFLPPVRAFVPVTAGALGMPSVRFYTVNLIAIVLWALAHVVPGIAAGALYHRAGVMAGHLLLPIGAGAIAAVLVVWALRRPATDIDPAP